MGRDIVELQAESKWDSGFFNQLSLDMRTAFPDETGFSVTNLKYMKRWYAFYNERVTIRQRVVDEKSQRVVGQLDMPEFFGRVPWGQHIDIVSRCETIEEALFYVQHVVDEGWSRQKLNANIDKHLYQSQGAAITNFELDRSRQAAS